MFNATQLVIDAFVQRLQQEYVRNYGHLESSYGEIISWAGHMALERIARTDAFYHDMDHTIMVTMVGQEILRGRHLREGGVSPCDWLHCMISLLCHDIGYVRGVCQGDQGNTLQTGQNGQVVDLPPGATDAFLTPYHVDRGILFIQERFNGHDVIDTAVVAENISLTRFPVPDAEDNNNTLNYPGLVRAADLIGQLADPDYLRKLPALFHEFEETGLNTHLGYDTPADLRRSYPAFYWTQVHPYIGKALEYLDLTLEGRQWTANLYAHVFATEHENR